MRFPKQFCAIIFFWFQILCVCDSPSQAEDFEIPSPLRLRDAVRLALERNPTVKASENDVEIADATRSTASRRLNPALTVNLENPRPFSANQGPFFRTTEQYALFSYEVETAAKRRLRTAAADFAVEAAQASLEDRKRLLVLEVERAYYRAVLAQSNLTTAESILGEIDRIVELNLARYRTGDISGGELKRIELERLRFQDDLFASKLQLRNAKSELLAWFAAPDLGRDFQLGEPLTVNLASLGFPDSSSPPSIESLQERALAQRPDLREAFREEQRADTETLHQQAIRSPNMTVVGGLKRTGGFNTLAVGITVPLKIFNRNEGGIARATAELARARNLAASTRTGLLLDIQKAYNAVTVNKERVQSIEQDYLERSEQSRQILTVSYRLGEANLMDLLDAERAYRETRKVYNLALYEYCISLYELAAAVGEEFPL